MALLAWPGETQAQLGFRQITIAILVGATGLERAHGVADTATCYGMPAARTAPLGASIGLDYALEQSMAWRFPWC